MKKLICECGSCGVCKSRERMRREREEHPERVRARDRNRYYRNWEKRRAAADEYARRHPEVVAAAKKRWEERNYDKKKAQTTANNAVRDGKLLRQACELTHTGECRGRVHKHHDDYSQPLEVRWLCIHHHNVIHRKIRSG